MIKKIIKRITPNSFHNFVSKTKRFAKFWRKGVKCPICNEHFREFQCYGVQSRRNAQCPKCGSLERHRLIWMYLKKTENIANSKRKLNILHFAPEKVLYNFFLSRDNINYYPVDLDPKLFHYYGLTEVNKADITSIPFEDNYFDIILCNHVLEHIKDDRKAMKELFRVTKIGGYGIFQVPIDYNREKTYEDFTITEPEERFKAFGQKDHVRWYGRDYSNRLRGAGYKVKEDNFIDSFTKIEIFKFGLMDNEIIYKCCRE